MPKRPTTPPIDRWVWRCARTGSFANLRLTADLLPPDPAFVQVRVAAVGLNFADVFACLGLYSATPTCPFIPGLEFAGTVIGAPPEAGFAVGDPVMGVTRFGAFATAVQVCPAELLALPAGWSLAQGAAWPVQALTAWYALRQLGDLQAGQRVLVHAAAGGVGLHAVAMAKRLGATVVGTVGSAAKVDFLQEQGQLDAANIVVRRSPRHLRCQLAALPGPPGFDLVLDSLGGPWFRPAYATLRPGGRHLLFGAAAMTPRGRRPNWLRLAWQYLRRPRVDALAMISANRAVMGFNLIWLWDRIDRLAPLAREILALDLPPPCLGERYPFTELPTALRRFKTGQTVGKLVLVVGG